MHNVSYFTMTEKNCQALPAASDKTYNTNSTVAETVVNATCKDGARFPDGRRWKMARCMFNSKWSNTFEKCSGMLFLFAYGVYTF